MNESAPSSTVSRSRICASTSRTATAPGPTSRRTPPRSTRPARWRRPSAMVRRRRTTGSGSSLSRRRAAGAGCARSTSSSASSPGALTDGFVITLPKVTSVEQVEAMLLVLSTIEQAHDLPAESLKFEIQIETPQAILGPDGSALVARMIHAGGGRVTGLHYGTYDYSASLGVAAAYQSMDHPVADHAKDVMQLAAASTGVFVSDGSTNVLPVGDREAVHAAWRLHFGLVRRSLARGIYQGWDMHPAQLPTRYAATYLFYREGLETAGRSAACVRRRRQLRLPGRACDGRRAGGLRAARPGMWCRRPGRGRQADRCGHRGSGEVGPTTSAVVTASGLASRHATGSGVHH